MHTLNQLELARQVARERAHVDERAFHRPAPPPPRMPRLPLRGRVAYAAGRFASRMDREMARRAVV